MQKVDSQAPVADRLYKRGQTIDVPMEIAENVRFVNKNCKCTFYFLPLFIFQS